MPGEGFEPPTFGLQNRCTTTVLTRPLALLLMLYTLATAIIGHHYWTMTGMNQFEAMINFYKNVSIMGGLLLLYVTGPGKYSIDARLNWA